MSARTAPRRVSVLGLLGAAVLAACGPKEQAPPPASTLTAAPTTTTTTTTTTTVPSPPPVWNSARWGMTKDQVLAAFPGQAQRLPQPADFGRPTPGSTDVAIAGYELEGVKFRVLFGFESDGLDRIQLAAAKPTDATCGDVERLLTEKHGAPSDRSSTQTTVKGEQVLWRLRDQTITLACAEAPGLGYRSVTVDYTAPSKAALSTPSSPADKGCHRPWA